VKPSNPWALISLSWVDLKSPLWLTSKEDAKPNQRKKKKSIIKKDLTGGFEFIRKKGDQVAWSTLTNSASQALRSSEEEEKKISENFTSDGGRARPVLLRRRPEPFRRSERNGKRQREKGEKKISDLRERGS
jgi:hypothetical protein